MADELLLGLDLSDIETPNKGRNRVVAVDVASIDYRPKIEERGWFFGKSLDEGRLKHEGSRDVTEALLAINYDYRIGEFERCSTASLSLLENNPPKSLHLEITDIFLRSCIKSGAPTKALPQARETLETANLASVIGLVMPAGDVFRAANHFKESTECYIAYLSVRYRSSAALDGLICALHNWKSIEYDEKINKLLQWIEEPSTDASQAPDLPLSKTAMERLATFQKKFSAFKTQADAESDEEDGNTARNL